MAGLEDGAVAVEVPVGGGLDVAGGEAGDDGDGEDVEVEEEVIDQGCEGRRRGHGVVAGDPAAALSFWSRERLGKQ